MIAATLRGVRVLAYESRESQDKTKTYHSLVVFASSRGNWSLDLDGPQNGGAVPEGEIVDIDVELDVQPGVSVKDGRGWVNNSANIRAKVVKIKTAARSESAPAGAKG